MVTFFRKAKIKNKLFFSNRKLYNQLYQKDKMEEKVLKKIIQEFFSSQGIEKLIDLLYKKQNVNEFLIAKKMGLTINQTRNILYKLADEGLVSFIRKKDKKKGGWYTYFWTLQIKKILLKYREKIERIILELLSQYGIRKKEIYYYCPNCHAEYDQERALLNNYTCPECGEVLQTKNPEEMLKNIEKEMQKLREILERTKVQIDELESKEQKSKKSKMNREIRKKEKERVEKRAELKKAKEKLAKLTNKMKTKKKKKQGKKQKKKHISKKKKRK